MRNIERGIVLMNKSFRNKLFICFLLMLLITGCGKKEVENENLIEKEADETADENLVKEESEEITEEVLISDNNMEAEDNTPKEEETDRGKESPLAVYGGEQLGKEIQYCHEADYDQDGKNEVIFTVETDRTDEEELDRMEIYFVDDDYEITLIDTQEIGMPEDQQDREEYVWYPDGKALGKYDGSPGFCQRFIVAGSNGYSKEILYGCIEGEPIKLKESEGVDTVNHGVYLRTTYLYDGSISDVTDKGFLKICAGDFSGVVGGTGNLNEDLEKWYADKIIPQGFQHYECDVDHDGTNELYIVGKTGSAAVFHKGREGMECWAYDSFLELLDDGSFLHLQSVYEDLGTSCDISTVICFDSNGNQEIVDEYARVWINGEIADWENSEILKEFSIEKNLEEKGCFYFQNRNPITENEYFNSLCTLCVW